MLMKTFEITYADGTRNTVKAPNWREIYTSDEVIKIEVVYTKLVHEKVDSINERFHKLGLNYHKSLGAVKQYLIDTLNANKFDGEALRRAFDALPMDAQSVRCQSIGFGFYIAVTWYKMPSGSFEIVAYVS